MVVGAGGLSYRAYDQGVFEAGEGGAYAAWESWESGRGPLALVSAAVLAANPHDTQAWVFRTTTTSVDVFADRARSLGSIDLYDRELHTGLGCALENLLQAAPTGPARRASGRPTAISPALSLNGRVAGARRHDRLAGRLALAGASLGVLVGILELAIGPSIREWVGDKQDTTRLGLTTIALSTVALVAAAALRQRRGIDGRRVVVALALLLPALICFTTVGRFWYPPGALLLGAGGLVLSGTRPRESAAALDERHLRIGLLAVCGAYHVFLGATALGIAGALGVVGGVLIWAAARTARQSPRTAYTLLLGGALPFAAATWWSVVTPILAVVTVVVGRGVIRRGDGASS